LPERRAQLVVHLTPVTGTDLLRSSISVADLPEWSLTKPPTKTNYRHSIDVLPMLLRMAPRDQPEHPGQSCPQTPSDLAAARLVLGQKGSSWVLEREPPIALVLAIWLTMSTAARRKQYPATRKTPMAGRKIFRGMNRRRLISR